MWTDREAGDDRAPGLFPVDRPLHVAAGIRDTAMAGRGRHVASQVVQVHVQALEELERPSPRAVEGDGEGRTLAAGQEPAGQDVHRLHQVVEPAEVDGGLGDVLRTVPVGLDVALDDSGPKLGWPRCRVLREVPKDRRVGPAGAGLDPLGAHEDAGMISGAGRPSRSSSWERRPHPPRRPCGRVYRLKPRALAAPRHPDLERGAFARVLIQERADQAGDHLAAGSAGRRSTTAASSRWSSGCSPP